MGSGTQGLWFFVLERSAQSQRSDMGHNRKRMGAVCAGMLCLAGCTHQSYDAPATRQAAPVIEKAASVGNSSGRWFQSSPFGSKGVDGFPAQDGFAATQTEYDRALTAQSSVIQDLISRRSVLPEVSGYAQVAEAVLRASAHPAEAELRAARLRAEAHSKNWLPTLGPAISLTGLGDVVAQLVVDQVIFDNGRRRGARALALADVEVAAVTLATETNDRVAAALTLYLAVHEAEARAARDAKMLKDVERFAYIMSERVRGGVSDRADLNVIRQKQAELRAAITAQRAAANTARAELTALTEQVDFDRVKLGDFRAPAGPHMALVVAEAQAVEARTKASLVMERAGQVPGIAAQARVGAGGGVVAQTTGAGIGFGMRARLRALGQAEAAATRTYVQTRAEAERALTKLTAQIAMKEQHHIEAIDLTKAARANLTLFKKQYAAGQRQVMDVLSVLETFAARERAASDLLYDAQRLRIEHARMLGLLVDGNRI